MREANDDSCPKCGLPGEYETSEFQDFFIEQKAECQNGHRWVELAQVTHYAMLDENDEQVGRTRRVQIINNL